MNSWDLALGQEDSRTAIHSRHLGSESRGISAPGRRTGRHNIMLWWRPKHGEGYGYVDGWTADGDAFYFTGTGQLGDQVFGRPLFENGRVRDHVANGDRIRLLKYVGKNSVRYVGELRLDPSHPWTWIDGPDAAAQTRRMIQFRFLPVETLPVPPEDRLRADVALSPQISAIGQVPAVPSGTDVEAVRTPEFRRLVGVREQLVSRTEATLVQEFSVWLVTQLSVQATGLSIPYSAESRNLRADLYLPAPHALVEAKSSAAREHIRMAIGQLLDYSRYVKPAPRLMLLTPVAPPDDMKSLLTSLGIAYAWGGGTAFEMSPEASSWLL
jgi:hypothetical protein